ncbi:MAG TPA: glycoside hydrolase family 5 protein [Patescibacteria group bacterium]
MKNIFRGVNLGGWLVLEKWITPSLFSGYTAEDEWSFCRELGNRAFEVVDRHRQSYITRDDFAWIAERGLNAVRIPIGHGIFGDAPPYLGAIEYLDFAIEAAKDYGLSVIIDVHTASGSQNGWDHSGQKGAINWPNDVAHRDQSLFVLKRLGERYQSYPHVIGIELLNEPHWTIQKPILETYYRHAYETLRREGYQNKIVIHDAFDPPAWIPFMTNSSMGDVVLDMHMYQCFSDEDKALNFMGHLEKTYGEWGRLISQIQEKVPVVVGEWSLGLDPLSLKGLSDQEKGEAFKSYGKAQLEVFEKAQGWFFWTYKTEDMPHWSFRDCVTQGLLPDHF